ncbi:hypothetical protein ACFXPN_34435 [Streptomyces griseorubiginosus]|uniref:hypothetical protein n=1 Tax=Streptomyces griseorubiginosus TaxID=67304 RepID=UPI002E819A86|nr:hypothetical protein [Streptomyces griseorubiginosus]WUB50235.1 hypothetical protein OHN19_20885 [Streptomyces griseorubiginosus]WUB58760.1 hypothetical protein OG942_20885 [Streptomyces griseorubiginosus]
MDTHRHRCEVAVLERTSTTARYTRGFAAAVVAVATLVLAANTGPAKASGERPAEQANQVQHITDPTQD